MLHGKRRGLRPLASRESIHLVMRSSWAIHEYSFRHSNNRSAVHSILQSMARKFGVKIYQKAVMGNHVHLVLRITNRILYRKFIRAATGLIAAHIMNGDSFKVFRAQFLRKRGKAPSEEQGLEQNFWQFRPFTRMIHWGRDFRYACSYLRQNLAEALGFVPYRPRRDRYAHWLKESVELQV